MNKWRADGWAFSQAFCLSQSAHISASAFLETPEFSRVKESGGEENVPFLTMIKKSLPLPFT